MHRDHISRNSRQKNLPDFPFSLPAAYTVIFQQYVLQFCVSCDPQITSRLNRYCNLHAVAFKEISLAHGLLSDPEKRRKYDVGGFDNLEASDLDMEIDVSQLGVTGAAFAAMFSKLGVPIKTAVSKSVMDTVRSVSPSTLHPTHVYPSDTICVSEN